MSVHPSGDSINPRKRKKPSPQRDSVTDAEILSKLGADGIVAAYEQAGFEFVQPVRAKATGFANCWPPGADRKKEAKAGVVIQAGRYPLGYFRQFNGGGGGLR